MKIDGIEYFPIAVFRLVAAKYLERGNRRANSGFYSYCRKWGCEKIIGCLYKDIKMEYHYELRYFYEKQPTGRYRSNDIALKGLDFLSGTVYQNKKIFIHILK